MEKQKFIGGVDFDELRAQRVQVYNTFTVDLATARTDVEYIYTGNYIYVLEATDTDTLLQVKLNEKIRNLIPLYKGRGIRAPFYRLYLTNAAQTGKSITLAIGVESDSFEVQDFGKALEISGEVYTNEWYKDTALLRAFSQWGNAGPIAGQYSAVQLCMLGGSDRTAYCNKIEGYVVGVMTSPCVKLRHHTTSFTLVRQGENKLLGGAAGIASVRQTTSAGLTGDELAIIGVDADQRFSFEAKPAILLPPGKMLHVETYEINLTLVASFEWVER